LDLRILYLNPVGALGGGERCLLSMLRAVRQAEPSAEVHLIVCTAGPLIEQAEALGAQVRLLEMPERLAGLGDSALKQSGRLGASFTLVRRGMAALPAGRRYVQALREAIEAIAPDLVHSNGIKTHLLTRLTGWHAGPVLWHLHDFLGSRRVMSRVLRQAAGGIDGAVAISQAVAEDAREVLPAVPIDIVLNAIDTDHFSPAPADPTALDALAGLPAAAEGTVRIGLVATYARWKGQAVFLEAAAQLAGQVGEAAVRFYLIGGPIYKTHGSQFSREELEARAADLGLAGRVGFVPFQADPAGIYRSLDVVVHASTQPEPFGLTIIEAMACGRAVIVSQAGGAAELFTPGEDALGTPPGDVAALAAAMGELLQSAQVRQTLGVRARQTALRRFDQRRLGPQLAALYRQALQRFHPSVR
jgi:glycosyltransferase involved in cell wall biosynthesis